MQSPSNQAQQWRSDCAQGISALQAYLPLLPALRAQAQPPQPPGGRASQVNHRWVNRGECNAALGRPRRIVVDCFRHLSSSVPCGPPCAAAAAACSAGARLAALLLLAFLWLCLLRCCLLLRRACLVLIPTACRRSIFCLPTICR